MRQRVGEGREAPLGVGEPRLEKSGVLFGLGTFSVRRCSVSASKCPLTLESASVRAGETRWEGSAVSAPRKEGSTAPVSMRRELDGVKVSCTKSRELQEDYRRD